MKIMETILGVGGNPILQSKSPALHQAAMKYSGIPGTSLRLAGESGRDLLELAEALGLQGFNVTAPYKEELVKLLDTVSPSVQKLGAVNTVVRRQGKWEGHNTDLVGVAKSLAQHGRDLMDGSSAVVLGAGGAARAAVLALQQLGLNVTVHNRSQSRLQDLLCDFQVGGVLHGTSEAKASLGNASVIVNTIAEDVLPFQEKILREEVVALDARYGSDSLFSKALLQRGIRVISGLEWLLWQGVEACQLLLGVRPDEHVVREALQLSRKPAAFPIALIGMMGSGKSTVAPLLAHLLQRECIEVDVEIEKVVGMSIAELVRTQGERAFRKVEYSVLSSLAQRSNVVLSCGGGPVTYVPSSEVLRQSTHGVWLWASPEKLLDRIGDDVSRPLLQEDPLGRLQELQQERGNQYAACADMVIQTEAKTPQQVARRIGEEFQKTFLGT